MLMTMTSQRGRKFYAPRAPLSSVMNVHENA